MMSDYDKEVWGGDEFEFKLHTPLTEEDWDKIRDSEHENTRFVTFQTPQGKQVKYIKMDVLDEIKAEIKGWYWDVDKQKLAKDPCVVDAMVDLFIRTIDKYRAGSEEA